MNFPVRHQDWGVSSEACRKEKLKIELPELLDRRQTMVKCGPLAMWAIYETPVCAWHLEKKLWTYQMREQQRYFWLRGIWSDLLAISTIRKVKPCQTLYHMCLCQRNISFIISSLLVFPMPKHHHQNRLINNKIQIVKLRLRDMDTVCNTMFQHVRKLRFVESREKSAYQCEAQTTSLFLGLTTTTWKRQKFFVPPLFLRHF